MDVFDRVGDLGGRVLQAGVLCEHWVCLLDNGDGDRRWDLLLAEFGRVQSGSHGGVGHLRYALGDVSCGEGAQAFLQKRAQRGAGAR